MLNPIQNAEAIYSATYVDNYIDSVENLPDDVQRQLSRIRDIDVQYRTYLRDVDHYYDLWKSMQNGGESLSKKRQNAVTRMQQSLIQAQELGDEKMQIVNQLQEIIDYKTRQLDTDQKNLDIKDDFQQQHRVDQLQSQTDDGSGPTVSKQSRTQSPTRGEQMTGVNGASGVTVGGNGSGSSGGGSTPNSERSGHTSNGATASGAINGNNVTNATNSSITGSDIQRSVSKRSRRRNDNATNNSNAGLSNMELGGNESNSANETGSNGGNNERHLSQKLSSGATQKKNSAQNQSGTGAGSGQGVASGNASGSGAGGTGGTGTKKKKRKARGTQSSTSQANAREETPPDPIDPDEPTYCVCNQISFGEMILCDNDLCPIEWFHFSCVALVLKPKGRWFCPNCRGDRPNVMKPKAQFLKELEKYNKEKEEKT